VLLGDFNIDLLGKSTANRLLKSFALVLSKVNCLPSSSGISNEAPSTATKIMHVLDLS